MVLKNCMELIAKMRASKKFLIRLTVSTFILISATSFIAVQLSRFSQDASLSQWHADINGYIDAQILQRDTGKPIFAFFYTDWCPNCKKLREQILSSTEFRNYSDNKLILLKINPENGKLENQLAEEFGVMGYPTVLLLPNNENQFARVSRTANVSPTQFVSQVSELLP